MLMEAMFSHIGDGEWEEKPLAECLALVADGKAYECNQCDYDDNRRTFHCKATCQECDVPLREPE